MKLFLLILIILLSSIQTLNQNIRQVNSLIDFVEDVKRTIPKEKSQKFIEPFIRNRTNFNLTIKNILNGKIKDNDTLLKSVNYELFNIKDKRDGKVYLVLKEKQIGFNGQGTYIFDLKFKKNIILEVPHPLFDAETPEEAVKIMKGIGARAIFIAGTHRCANKEKSSCSGKTTACSGILEDFRISDAGHNVNTFFQEAHRATISFKSIVISLHGNNDDVPSLLISDGTEGKRATTYITNKLRNQIKTDVGSCNLKIDKNFNLCGTTNVQGRLSNGAKDACQITPKIGNGLFIHIEQSLEMRNNPSKLISALNKIL